VAVQDDRVILLRTFGQRDRERSLAVTPDTLFPIGSCTKSFTAMAVMLSREAGLLTLEDSPHRFLPYFKMADPQADAAVTLRDMLSHQTGLKAYADLAAEPGVLTREQYVKAATGAKPVAPIRTRFQYSNAMYSAVGEVLGRVHGVPWEAVIEKTIFRPLGMARSVATLDALPADADHAVGYTYDAARAAFTPAPPPNGMRALAPGGAIASTARDLARWLRFLTAGGVIDGRRVASQASLREVARPRSAVNDAWSYGLGWATYRWNGHTVVEHNGGSEGISALVSFIPERRIGFALLANMSPGTLTRISNAGNLLWPILLAETGPPTPAPHPSPSPTPTPVVSETPPGTDLPSAADVLSRMVAAEGGEASLQRHRSFSMQGRRIYANQGVEADLQVWAEAPDRRSEDEAWRAAGVPIGRYRSFFDGARGGQETTFGQDEMYGDEENDRVRREALFHPALDAARVYKDVRLRGTGSAAGEDTWVLDLTTTRGTTVVWHVSKRTGLLLQTEAGGKVTTFADYRDVDGQRVPFRATSQEALGEVVTEVQEARYNVDVPPGVFAPRPSPAPR